METLQAASWTGDSKAPFTSRGGFVWIAIWQILATHVDILSWVKKAACEITRQVMEPCVGAK